MRVHKYTLLKDRLHHLFTVCNGYFIDYIILSRQRLILEVCVDGHTKLCSFIYSVYCQY